MLGGGFIMSKDRMQTILIYIAVLAVWLLAGWFLLNFPAWFVVHSFVPKITQSDITNNLYTDYTGYRAGEDIPRLKSAKEYEEGVYTRLDFVTVETANIIPLDAYRLKDPADVNSTEQYVGGRRTYSGQPLVKYTDHPRRRSYLYGRYYLLELEDGSYVIAYGDRGYGAVSFLGKTITFPIGRLQSANSPEQQLLEDVGETYPVNTEEILYMINDDKVGEWNFLDLLIRCAAFAIVVAVFLIFIIIKVRRKKGAFLRRRTVDE
jgi:hypothetical protein